MMVTTRRGLLVFFGLLLGGIQWLPGWVLWRVLPAGETQPFSSSVSTVLLGAICLALITAAALLRAGLEQFSAPDSRRAALSYLTLGGLLIARSLYSFYAFIIWDATYDPLGVLWLFIPSLAVIIAAVVLMWARAGRMQTAGLAFLLLIPVLVGVFLLATSVNYRLLTTNRAEQVNCAILAYHQRTGQYPGNLRQLAPDYLLGLPEPHILYGQGWCYQAGADFYRLGYVNRLHWSDPRLFAQLYAAQGQPDGADALCAAQISALQSRYPDYPYVFAADLP